MVSTQLPDNFDRIVDKLSTADLARLNGTRWEDEDGVEVHDVRLMASRLHLHGLLANIDLLTRLMVGSSFTSHSITLTRIE